MSQALKDRTKKFALDVWYLCSQLPHTREYTNYVNQLLRCSSSIAANYRAAIRAKSNADFINKLKIVEEESDESVYWLELIKAYNNIKDSEFEIIVIESKELEKIFAASAITAKKNLANSKK